MPHTEKSVTIIFNPVSGQGDSEQRKQKIEEALARHGYGCQFMATTQEMGAKALAEQAVRDGVDLLVVSGGDGTVMEAMSALIGTDIPIAVIPSGTGNLLSVNLGIPATVPDAIDVALSGHAYAIDLARTHDNRHFAIMGGLGLDAHLIADADREHKRRFGYLAYLWAALKNLPRHRTRVIVTLDDKPPMRHRVKTVLIANMGKITGGLEVLPTASPNDGLLDIGILKSETLGQWLRLAGYALLGRAQDDPAFEVHQAKRISISSVHSQPVEFDGEEGGQMRRLSVEIVPQAVRIMLPIGAPASRDMDEPPAQAAQRAARRLAIGPLLILGIALAWWLRRRSFRR